MTRPATRQRRPLDQAGAVNNHQRGRNGTSRVDHRLDYDNAVGEGVSQCFRSRRSMDRFLDRLEADGAQVRHRIFRRVIGGPARPKWQEVG